eukprot:1306303-Pyramimonas_sp.AAC.1
MPRPPTNAVEPSTSRPTLLSASQRAESGPLELAHGSSPLASAILPLSAIRAFHGRDCDSRRSQIHATSCCKILHVAWYIGSDVRSFCAAGAARGNPNR